MSKTVDKVIEENQVGSDADTVGKVAQEIKKYRMRGVRMREQETDGSSEAVVSVVEIEIDGVSQEDVIDLATRRFGMVHIEKIEEINKCQAKN